MTDTDFVFQGVAYMSRTLCRGRLLRYSTMSVMMTLGVILCFSKAMFTKMFAPGSMYRERDRYNTGVHFVWNPGVAETLDMRHEGETFRFLKIKN